MSLGATVSGPATVAGQSALAAGHEVMQRGGKDDNMSFALRQSTERHPDEVRHLPGPRASDAGCGPPSDLPEDVPHSILRPP